MIGTILDHKYKLLRLLEEGGMGTVYVAERIDSSERVAVKILSTPPSAEDRHAKRFRREAQATAAIQSDHIVAFLDAGVDEATGLQFLVMELLDGEDLQALVDRLGPLSPNTALHIAAQALLGLEQAHAKGIVHRDIKPSNIFLAKGPDSTITVKILDFGIAKILAEALPHTTGLTKTGGVIGSPLYMSPEQVEGSRAIDHRTDIWSLGSTLYCALAGHAPHQHRTLDSLAKLLVAIYTRQPPPLIEVAPWVPAAVREVVQGALHLDRNLRYPSAQAMLEAIRPLLQDELTLHAEMIEPVSASVRSALAATLTRDQDDTRDIPETTEAPISSTRPIPEGIASTEDASVSSEDPKSHEPKPVAPPSSTPTRSRSSLYLSIALVLLVAAVVVFSTRGASSPRPSIAPFSEGKRGIVLAGEFFGGEEGHAFCQELQDFDAWQRVLCFEIDADEKSAEELREKARGAGALLFGMVDRDGRARLAPLGQLEGHELLGQSMEINLARRIDWPRIHAVLGAMTAMAAPLSDAAPTYACPPLPEGDLDRVGLDQLLLVPSCATLPIDPPRLLGICRSMPASEDCALARYLYADRCPKCPDTLELLKTLRDGGPARFRSLAGLKLARMACKEGALEQATELTLSLRAEGGPCTRLAVSEIAACILSQAQPPGDPRLGQIESLPVGNDEQCPADLRAAILARRAYYRGRGGKWALAEVDFAEAYRLSHLPIHALSHIESLLHMGWAREAHERLLALSNLRLSGSDCFYAALLRWIAARNAKLEDVHEAAKVLVDEYGKIAPGARALEGETDPDLKKLACPGSASCVYDVLAQPKEDGALEKLQASLQEIKAPLQPGGPQEVKR